MRGSNLGLLRSYIAGIGSAVSVDRWAVKLDPFQERNLVLFQGNDKHTTVNPFWSGRFMFPNISAGAIIPVVAASCTGRS